MSNIITLQVDQDDEYAGFFESIGDEANFIESKAFDGASAVLSVIIAVSPFIAPEVTKIIQTYIERKKNIVTIHNGTEFRGLTHKEVAEFVKQIAENEVLSNSPKSDE